MKFWQAMMALDDGHRVRCTHWENGWYVHKHGGNPWDERLSVNKDGKLWTLDLFYCVTATWELYKEPESVLHLTCHVCKFTDIVSRNNAKEWKCPNCALIKTGMLSFADVVKGLKEGKRFRRKDWKAWIGKEHLWCARLAVEDFEATDWVEVE